MDLGAELCQRIDATGATGLDSSALQTEFAEVLTGLTPPGFELFPMPDECRVDPNDHLIRVAGALVDLERRQVVGTIARLLLLDGSHAEHEYLELQRPYRGSGLAILLLDRSFRLYERCGIERIGVHAALETGRWYWARLGFDFASPSDRALVATWGTVVLAALGQAPLPADSPARRWALLGSGSVPPQETSLEDLHSALEAHISARLAEPGQAPTYEAVAAAIAPRVGGGWLDRDRFARCAELNEIGFDRPVPLGKAIMLTGPDWYGVLDLTVSADRAAFDEELNRVLKKQAERKP